MKQFESSTLFETAQNRATEHVAEFAHHFVDLSASDSIGAQEVRRDLLACVERDLNTKLAGQGTTKREFSRDLSRSLPARAVALDSGKEHSLKNFARRLQKNLSQVDLNL